MSRCILPVTCDDGFRLDASDAREIGESLAGEYCFAEPYPHIVLDDFLPLDLALKLKNHFPAPDECHRIYKEGYAGQYKRQVVPEAADGVARDIFRFFNSGPFLQFLEGLTTIQKLVPDPYFVGGGFHETTAGGYLGIHADFRINADLNLHRRLNVIIYLNDAWQDEWGGHLEIWDRKMSNCCVRIAPLFNRCVIFNTEVDTYHGHPDPLRCPPEVQRRSAALYYYTASEAIFGEVANTGTLYAARPGAAAHERKEAWALRRHEILRDFAPPILTRLAKRAVKSISSMRKRK